jgi:arachidonate 5-lipoxygenase
MKRLQTWMWVLQFFVLSGVAVFAFLLPNPFFGMFGPGHAPETLPDLALPAHDVTCAGRDQDALVAAFVRLIAPTAIGLSLFSSLAAMREDTAVRRDFARVFALVFGLWTLVLWGSPLRGPDAGPKTRFHWVIFGVAAFYAAFNLLSSFLPLGFRAPSRRGSADTKPPQLWVLWGLQGIYFVVVEHLLGLLLGKPLHGGAEVALALQSTSAAFTIGMGLFSFQAMSADRECNWSVFCRIFQVWFVLRLVTLLFVWNGALFSPWRVAILTVAPLGFLLANRRLGGRREWVSEEVGEGPDGWTPLELVSGPILILQSLTGGRRATHLYGVGARGQFEVAPASAFSAGATSPTTPVSRVPRNAFLVPGAELELWARFATVTFPDDASFDVRGAAIRLRDRTHTLDVLMNTGAYSPSHNIVHFTIILFTKSLGTWSRKLLSRNDHQGREGGIAGLRRAPESFAKLHFYSQTVRFWIDENDVRYLVRYRLVPEDPSYERESGLAGPGDSIWTRARHPTETRAPNYLREELKRRIEGTKSVKLRFQAQFHRPEPGDDLHWYDPSVDWHAGDHPWLDLGEVRLEEPLPDEQAERLEFNSDNHPPTLGIPIADGMLDYRSMGDTERRIIRRLQGLRAWIYSVRGLPKFGNTLRG